MTISTTTSEVVYTTATDVTIYAVPFYFLLATDLAVSYNDGTNDVDLGLNSDYTVEGSGALTGGSITLGTALTAGWKLTIGRVVPVTQLTDYIQDDAFPAESHEKALDKLTMICQQLQSNIDNAVLTSTTEGQANTASNIGNGLGVYKEKVALDLRFRSISSPSSGTIGMAIANDRIEIDVKYLLVHANTWSVGEQKLDYTIPHTASTPRVDNGGWTAFVHNNVADQNTESLTSLTGHAYHEGTWTNLTGAAWGVVTEAWSNSSGSSTLIGGEFAAISRYPAYTSTEVIDAVTYSSRTPSIGANVVFKNRGDEQAHPDYGSGTPLGLYNQNAWGLFITSQARPSGTGAAWSNVGSGWNSAIKIGDIGFGSGLDWEGGNLAKIYVNERKYSTILDLTNVFDVVYGATKDMGGGYPWLFLYRDGKTYFGARFVGGITTNVQGIVAIASVPDAGGTQWTSGFTASIDGGTGGLVTVTAAGGAGTTATAVTLLQGGTGTFPGYYTGRNIRCTKVGGGDGDGLKIYVKEVNGPRIEFWRMNDPGDPTANGGRRYGFIDLSYIPPTAIGHDGPFIKSDAILL